MNYSYNNILYENKTKIFFPLLKQEDLFICQEKFRMWTLTLDLPRGEYNFNSKFLLHVQSFRNVIIIFKAITFFLNFVKTYFLVIVMTTLKKKKSYMKWEYWIEILTLVIFTALVNLVLNSNRKKILTQMASLHHHKNELELRWNCSLLILWAQLAHSIENGYNTYSVTDYFIKIWIMCTL